jgi:flagellar motor switch/type III secretory pathway protein FliN
METSRPWLPRAAIERGARDVPLHQVVSDWSSKWFARRAAVLAGDPITTASDTTGGGWELAHGIALVPAADAEAAVIALLFGSQEGAEELTAADQAALGAVVESCFTDLRSRLATAFRLPGDAAWRPTMTAADGQPRWVWRVQGDKGGALVKIAVDEALLVRRIRSGLPSATGGRSLTALHAALAGQPVGVSALVGRCRLTTSELAGLGQGDVVVLDRLLGDVVELAVDGDLKPMPCTVDERDGCLTLTLRLMDRPR